MVRVSCDAGVTTPGVDVAPVVEFVAAPTGIRVNVRRCKRGLPGDDKPDSTAVKRDWTAVGFAEPLKDQDPT